MGFVKTLTVKISDPLFAEIQATARARKVTKSAVVRERLEKATGSELSLWDRMKDLVIKDGSLPRDLSSNKEHLRGYGKSRSHR